MRWFWIALVGTGAFFAYQQMQPAMPQSAPEHAQVTQMAKQAEAKAQQAAQIASRDTVAEYEQKQE